MLGIGFFLLVGAFLLVIYGLIRDSKRDDQ